PARDAAGDARLARRVGAGADAERGPAGPRLGRAVHRLDVVAVRVEEVGGVVVGRVAADAGRPVVAPSCIETRPVERVRGVPRLGDEGEMQDLARRTAHEAEGPELGGGFRELALL